MSNYTRPPAGFLTITPSDTRVYDPPLKTLFIEADGDIAVVGRDNIDGDGVERDAGPTVFTRTAGSLLRGYIVKVMATGTTSTKIIAGR